MLNNPLVFHRSRLQERKLLKLLPGRPRQVFLAVESLKTLDGYAAKHGDFTEYVFEHDLIYDLTIFNMN